MLIHQDMKADYNIAAYILFPRSKWMQLFHSTPRCYSLGYSAYKCYNATSVSPLAIAKVRHTIRWMARGQPSYKLITNAAANHRDSIGLPRTLYCRWCLTDLWTFRLYQFTALGVSPPG